MMSFTFLRRYIFYVLAGLFITLNSQLIQSAPYAALMIDEMMEDDLLIKGKNDKERAKQEEDNKKKKKKKGKKEEEQDNKKKTPGGKDWVKGGTQYSNSSLAGGGISNNSSTVMRLRTARKTPVEVEMDNNEIETISLLPENRIDYKQVMVQRGLGKNTKESNTLMSFLKPKKKKKRVGFVPYASVSAGYSFNFTRKSDEFYDTPMSVGFNTVSSNFIPLTATFGLYSPTRKYRFYLSLSNLISNRGVVNKVDTLQKKFSGVPYIYSMASYPSTSVLTVGLGFTGVLKRFVVAGRDVNNVSFKLGGLYSMMSYKDYIRVTTAELVPASGDNSPRKNYYIDYKRTFPAIMFFGGTAGINFNTRINRNIVLFLDIDFNFMMPAATIVKSSEIVSRLPDESTNQSLDAIPWLQDLESSFKSINVHSSYTVNTEFGVRYLF